MSRGLSATNQAQVDAAHLHEVILVRLDFDTPVFVHSGYGEITYDSNVYIGVGHLGSIDQARESEALGPSPITLNLSGIPTTYIAEALDSGNLYDTVTIYQGYRQDDGTLYDTPWLLWRGWYEYGAVRVGEDGAVSITCQHDLSQLDEKDGGRYSDEDQQSAYTGDVGLEFASDSGSVTLLWGGGPVVGAPSEGPAGGGPVRRR